MVLTGSRYEEISTTERIRIIAIILLQYVEQENNRWSDWAVFGFYYYCSRLVEHKFSSGSFSGTFLLPYWSLPWQVFDHPAAFVTLFSYITIHVKSPWWERSSSWIPRPLSTVSQTITYIFCCIVSIVMNGLSKLWGNWWNTIRTFFWTQQTIQS